MTDDAGFFHKGSFYTADGGARVGRGALDVYSKAMMREAGNTEQPRADAPRWAERQPSCTWPQHTPPKDQ